MSVLTREDLRLEIHSLREEMERSQNRLLSELSHLRNDFLHTQSTASDVSKSRTSPADRQPRRRLTKTKTALAEHEWCMRHMRTYADEPVDEGDRYRNWHTTFSHNSHKEARQDNVSVEVPPKAEAKGTKAEIARIVPDVSELAVTRGNWATALSSKVSTCLEEQSKDDRLEKRGSNNSLASDSEGTSTDRRPGSKRGSNISYAARNLSAEHIGRIADVKSKAQEQKPQLPKWEQGERNSYRDTIGWLIYSWQFEYAFFWLIVFNGITTGVEMQYMTSNLTTRTPLALEIIEFIFTIVFTLEVLARVYVSRVHFFRGPGRELNLFDCVVIFAQILALIIAYSVGSKASSINVLRLVRLIRLVRVARTVRVLRTIGEVRAIVWSVASSFKPLCGAIIILSFLAFLLAIYFTELVLTYRLTLNVDDPIHEDFIEHYGTMVICMFSLWKAISGGIDWGDMAQPLIEHISPWMALVFSVYIAFALLALMNTITGVFIQIALRNGTVDKDNYMKSYFRSAFAKMDIDENGLINWDQFETALKGRNLEELFSFIGLDVSEARCMFDVLDLSGDGHITTEEFLSGCFRLRGEAKALDLILSMRETKRLFGELFTALDEVCEMVAGSDHERATPIEYERATPIELA